MTDDVVKRMFDIAPFPMTLTAPEDGELLYANRRAYEFYGLDPDVDSKRKVYTIEFYSDPEFRRKIVEVLRRDGCANDAVIPMKLASGEVRWMSFNARVVQIEGGTAIMSAQFDVTERMLLEREKEKLIAELSEALEKVKVLEGILPICSRCKKIRDEKGAWSKVETYIASRTDAKFSHSICPSCVEALYPELGKMG